MMGSMALTLMSVLPRDGDILNQTERGGRAVNKFRQLIRTDEWHSGSCSAEVATMCTFLLYSSEHKSYEFQGSPTDSGQFPILEELIENLVDMTSYKKVLAPKFALHP